MAAVAQAGPLATLIFQSNMGLAGYEITQPGTYKVMQDLNMQKAPGITITASNVVLDLNGHTLRGIYQPLQDVIDIGDDVSWNGFAQNVTVKNGTIIGNRGILFRASQNCRITGITFSGFYQQGILDEGWSGGHKIDHCTFMPPAVDTQIAILPVSILLYGSNDEITNNLFKTAQAGVEPILMIDCINGVKISDNAIILPPQ